MFKRDKLNTLMSMSSDIQNDDIDIITDFSKYKVMDLFCGIGGFTYGFEMTNFFEVILGVDMWKSALETFQFNHKNTHVLNEDLTNVKDELFLKYKNEVDVIIAGPPCQGFSMAGKREIGDNRNTLFEEVIRATKLINPKIVIIENVKGLLSMTNTDGVLIKDIIFEKFLDLNYKVKYEILNAADFGVPQKRERVFFVATKTEEFNFPSPYLKESEYITVGDAIGNIPDEGLYYELPETEYQKIMNKNNLNNEIFNHNKMNHSELILKRMSHVPQGGNWQNIPESLGQGGGQHSNNYKRLHSDFPSITIKHAQKSMIIHPKYDRIPTIREIARLQSFDDAFKLLGTKTDQHQFLANAVPPLLGSAIALKVKEYLDEV